MGSTPISSSIGGQADRTSFGNRSPEFLVSAARAEAVFPPELFYGLQVSSGADKRP